MTGGSKVVIEIEKKKKDVLSKAEFVGVEAWDDAVVKGPGLCLMRESPLIKTHGKKKDAEKIYFYFYFFFFLKSMFFFYLI